MTTSEISLRWNSDGKSSFYERYGKRSKSLSKNCEN